VLCGSATLTWYTEITFFCYYINTNSNPDPSQKLHHVINIVTIIIQFLTHHVSGSLNDDQSHIITLNNYIHFISPIRGST